MSKIKLSKKTHFKHKLALVEYIIRNIIYSVGLALLLLILYDVAVMTMVTRIAFIIVVIVAVIMHIDSMKRLAESMKNERVTFNFFK